MRIRAYPQCALLRLAPGCIPVRLTFLRHRTNKAESLDNRIKFLCDIIDSNEKLLPFVSGDEHKLNSMMVRLGLYTWYFLRKGARLFGNRLFLFIIIGYRINNSRRY
ncbi:hypothetical protein HMPREF1986_00064 [Oribacterium sp. oral taxon 078 str. F0263]|nr:hypothetical protein HMPREF1986_00064 [Oribacterium sp. oral taxon 078 str. F0263]